MGWGLDGCHMDAYLNVHKVDLYPSNHGPDLIGVSY